MTTTAGTDALQGRCAALAQTAHTLTSEELLDLAAGFQREIDAAVALRTIVLGHLSALEPRLVEDGTEVEEHRGLGHQRIDAPELAAPRLGVSVHKATQLIMTAVDQLTRTPQVVTALAAGELNEAKASAVTHETMFLPADSAREVTERVAEDWSHLTVGPLRTRVATIAAEVDPDAVAAHVHDTRSRRGLTRRTSSDGTDHWRADLVTEHARPAWAAVTERALQIQRDGDADTLEQARADALTQLILEHSDVTVVIHATRPAEPTTPAPDPEPAEPNATADTDAHPESASPQPATGTQSATPRPATVAAESESPPPSPARHLACCRPLSPARTGTTSPPSTSSASTSPSLTRSRPTRPRPPGPLPTRPRSATVTPARSVGSSRPVGSSRSVGSARPGPRSCPPRSSPTPPARPGTTRQRS